MVNAPMTGSIVKDADAPHQEVDAMRKPVEELVALAKKMNYENLDDFANAVAGSIRYKMSEGH